METSKILIPVKVDEIYPHPDNPRKDVGDISELAESIKKNGIMQNLSVIPGHYEDRELVEGGYTLIIGHRRYAACKKAGITEVPCRIIRDMSLKEQVSTMLEENMQRNDLTILEQAQGFQMMLDLGETEESIAEKTGFSKQTVKHRVNLAKLDQKLLKERQEQEDYQLTLKDLYQLEKVKSLDKRNEILELAESSNDISWEVEQAIKQEKVEENEAEVMKLIMAAGYEEAPASALNELYGTKWKRWLDIDLEKDINNVDMSIYPEDTKWLKSKYRDTIYLIQPQKVEEKKLTSYEKERIKEDENRKILGGVLKGLSKKFKDLAIMIMEGKIEVKEDLETYQKICKTAININLQILAYTEPQIIYKKSLYELKQDEELYKEYQEKIKNVPTIARILVHMLGSTCKNTWNWKLEYDKEAAEQMAAVMALAIEYGISTDNEEDQLIVGTHPAYKKEEVKE